jgi:diacylglycerol O-acyltransferase / wax synthase
MERLGSLDAVFIAIETAGCPMSVGQLSLFEGPAPSLDDVRNAIGERIATVPRCRQRVRESCCRWTRPVWADDPHFDIARHVHAADLADPSPLALEAFVERTMMIPLDRDRPLWEMWVVADAGDQRWAVLGKVHHSMVDGIAGTDLLSVLLGDRAATGSAATAVVDIDPSALQVTWFGVVSAIRSVPLRLAGLMRTLRHPVRCVRRMAELGAGARALWMQPRRRNSPLTGPIGTSRRWARVDVSLRDVALVRRANGGSVNDAVLTATALGFRSLLRARGVADRRDVMTLMPVSTRPPNARGLLDNRVAVTHALLPVDTDDPIAVLGSLRAHLAEVKVSHQSEASTVLLHSGDLVPNRLAAAIARGVVRAQDNLETVTTNVPGPRDPLVLCGRRMSAAWPFVPIAGRIRIAVAIWSTCDRLFIGVTGDGEGAGDVDVLARGIGDGFRSLVESSAR